MKRNIVLLLQIILFTSMANAQNVQLKADNIGEVLKRLTLEEKVSLIVGNHDAWTKKTETMIGHQEKIVPGSAGTTNAVARLGIPPTVMTDGPAGVRISETRKGENRTYYATGFPIETAMASTWNLDLIRETTKAMGKEVLDYGCDVILGPGTNIHRHPLCGRNFEYFSEDPVLSGRMATAYIEGVQSQGVGTSLKHFACNNQETMRMYNDSRVGERVLREIYLRPFEIAVKEANPWTVMSSYNRLNGKYTQYDERLLTTILRQEWGYKGLVVTDWTGTRDSTCQQVIAGNDELQPGNDQQETDLIEGVRDGRISMETVDKAVRRILEYIVKTPRFKGYKYNDNPDLKGHAEVVRQCADEAIVLLKNEENTLPLKKNETVALFGITSYDMIAGGTGSGDVHKAYISQLNDALKEASYALEPALDSVYTAYKSFAQAKRLAELGKDGLWRKPLMDESEVRRTVIDRCAKKADVAIITLGRTAGESTDRKIEGDFNLTPLEHNLINNVCEAFHLLGKKVIVIMNTSGVMETASWKPQPDAILMAWQPGEEAGHSLVDILSGKICPSGKLPDTMPICCTDHLSSRNFPLFGGNERIPVEKWNPRSTMEYTNYEEGLMVGYRYFQTMKKPVSYPFGYGLSYTTFAYSDCKVRKQNDGFEVSLTVQNTGKVAGKEVVELYVSSPHGGQNGTPESELKTFAKTRTLKSGEKQRLTMKVSNRELASYSEQKNCWIADKGNYQIRISSDVNTVKTILQYNLSKPITYEP